MLKCGVQSAIQGHRLNEDYIDREKKGTLGI